MKMIKIDEHFPSRNTIKDRVKTFWGKGKGVDGVHYKMAHLYEFAAKIYGYENWDTFSAILERNDERLGRIES